MKRKLSKICLGLATSAVLLAVNPAAQAQDGKTYLNCANGGAVRDPYGNCLLSAGGSAIAECAGVVRTTMKLSLAADALFDFDQSDLKPAGRASLDKLAADMQPLNVQSVDIVGHTDSKGSDAYNQGLSERRASSAADYLVARGVNPGIISARGMGERQPVAPNTNPDGSDNPEGRAKNRRVDITVDAEKTGG